jgi:16S rRNA (adenine1518-N6/adenine1519-N6)-dimethyltransferase
LIPILEDRFKNQIDLKKFELINIDVLDFWEKNKYLYHDNYSLVANLPYYISTNIILKALKDENCKNILVMTQKEVAQKFCANTNEKEFCAISVLTQSKAEAKILFDVPNSAFDPIPKVTSSVFLIQKNKNFDITKDFENFLRDCFKQPRKTLVKNLSSNFNKNDILEIFEKLNIGNSFRPHQLETFNYHLLFNDLIRKENEGRSSCNK